MDKSTPQPANICTADRQAALDAPEGTLQLEEVARFDHQVTGVSVSEEGRIFVNFPRWTEDTEISVAELLPDGTLKPYPDERWNEWCNTRKNELSAGDHWVCVQSVVADGRGHLWVLDPAAPATAALVPGGPKLVKIRLSDDRAVQTIAFDTDVAPSGSYLNDVRLSPDGHHAYITDSGGQGALVVVDLQAGRARRVLDAHPTVQAEKDVTVSHHGRPIRRPDGRGVEFAADGIELSRDGRTLYWQALTGRTLHAISTDALHDESLDEAALGAKVECVGENGVSDGLWIDARGRMYISALEEDAIKVRDGDTVTMLLQDERLRWPDTFSEGPDGWVYVTSSRIMDNAWHDPDAPRALPTTLWRFRPVEDGTLPTRH